MNCEKTGTERRLKERLKKKRSISERVMSHSIPGGGKQLPERGLLREENSSARGRHPTSEKIEGAEHGRDRRK